jgi:hypothetical protein
MKRECEGLDEYEIKAWIAQLESYPIKRIKHAMGEQDYSTNEAHLLLLENGKFAVVTEEGCSCYSSDEACINVYPDLETAETALKNWMDNDKSRKYF